MSEFAEDKYWSRVDMDEGKDGCWYWTGGCNTKGYGVVYIGWEGKPTMLAHRYAYGLRHGAVPDVVVHRCRNKCCVNPDHLHGYSHARHPDFNYPDRTYAHAVGEKHPCSKMTDDGVRTIRSLYAAGGITQTTLSTMFSISKLTVLRIVNRQTWKHVE